MASTDQSDLRPALTAELRSTLLAGGAWIPAVVVAAVIGGWAFGDGGYFPSDWYPATLGFVALLATIALAVGRAMPSAPAVRLALYLLAGLTAWSYLSVLFAGSAGSAWEQSNKLLLILAALWLLSLPRWTGRTVMVALGVWALTVGVACLAWLLSGVAADDLRDFLVVSRWDKPLGYPNGTAALACAGFWSAMVLAVRAGVPPWVRVGFVAVAAFLVEFSMIPQSRGAIISLIVGAPLFVVLVPDRLRTLSRLAAVGAGLALAIGPAFDVYSVAVEEKPVIPVLHDAAGSIALGVAVAVALVVVMELIEAWRRPGPETVRRAGRVVAIFGAVLAVAAAGVGLANAGSVSDSVSERWNKFKSQDESLTIETGPRLALDQSDQRYDYWRVSLNLFKEKPIAGVGSGNFERRYNAVRRDEKPSRYPHQVFLRFLGENGIVGLLLFLGYLGVVLGGAVRFARRAGPFERAAAAGAVTLAVGFLVHACFDWLDQFPSLMVPALGLPLLALAAAAPTRVGVALPARPRWATARAAAILVAASIAIVTIGASWISVRYLDQANGEWRLSPSHAFRDLDRADSLNPLSATARLTEGSVAIQLQRPERARRAFVRALEREENWYSWFELALLDAQAGRFARARVEIEKASALNASDAFVAEARRQIRARRHIDPVSFNAQVRGLTLFKEKAVR